MRTLTTLSLTWELFVSKSHLSSPKSGNNSVLVFLGCYVPRASALYVGGACPIFGQRPNFQRCFIVLSMLFYCRVKLAIIHSQSQPSSFFSIWYQYWFIFLILPGAKNYTPSSFLEKEMATHSSILTWRIPGTEEPGGLPSMGSHRLKHDWSDLAAAAAYSFWGIFCFFSSNFFSSC